MNIEKFNHEKLVNDTDPKEKNVLRRKFLKQVLGASIVGATGIDFALKNAEKKKSNIIFSEKSYQKHKETPVQEVEEKTPLEKKRIKINWREFKKLKPSVVYKEIVPPLQMENLKMPDRVNKYGARTFEGKILRTLRFKNITDAVESRYNLPPRILLAMIIEESTGVDLLPNARGDGGFGLCHMQGLTASEYGLKTFKGCNALVCNGRDHRSCKGAGGKLENHAKELANFIKLNTKDREALIGADERLNPLINIDAAGRMLAAGISGPKLKGKLSGLDSLEVAIARYAGSYNYKNYWRDINNNMRAFKNTRLLDSVKQNFNKKNPNLKINGKNANFHDYIAESEKQNLNYGLEEYKKLPKYLPKNSIDVLKVYGK